MLATRHVDGLHRRPCQLIHRIARAFHEIGSDSFAAILLDPATGKLPSYTERTERRQK